MFKLNPLFRFWERQSVTSLLDSMGRDGADYARKLVPVDTGKLKASIGYLVRQSDMTVKIYADEPYAIFVEEGTARAKAQPFLRPVLPYLQKRFRSVRVRVALGIGRPTF